MERLLICDNAGYANYSVYLCNAMAHLQKKYAVCYLTEKTNQYLEELDKEVTLSTNLYTGNRALKRKSLQWWCNRILGCTKVIETKIRTIRKMDPNVIIFQSLAPVYDQYVLKLLKKKAKIVFTVHNVIPHEKTIYWSMKSLKKVYDLCDCLIVHTEENKQELISTFHIDESKVNVINHGINLNYVSVNVRSERKKLGIEDDKPILLAYGGIRNYKGIDILIKACKNIKCHLIIAGATIGDIDFNDYLELIEENNIDAICINRFITNEESNILFQVADFIMLPYKEFHSQSGVFMQAIQYKKKVIASDVASFRSFVEQYDLGYVCKPNDVQNLNYTINNAINSISETNALDTVRQLFSWERSAKEYIRVIDSIDH